MTPWVVTLIMLSACALGPDYTRPADKLPEGFKEQTVNGAGWKLATPSDAQDRGPWWAIYRDPILDGLLAQVAVNNQNLKAAEASYRQGKALADAARSNLFPNIGANGSYDRSGSFGTTKTATAKGDTFSGSLSAAWELDIWGRIRRDIERAEATADASAADLANARLSAQAELAGDYFILRSQDDQKRLLDETVESYADVLKIAQNQYKAGIIARTDVVQAETQLKAAQTQAVNTGVQRAQMEHAIAVLMGKTPSDVTIKIEPLKTGVPEVPLGVPSALLERRPDIAAAERRMIAANARIGIAEAAFFPAISLGGNIGQSSSTLGNLFSAASNFWSIGPALAVTLFDAGARAAQEEAARAAYDEQLALYRQTVLAALQDVEDQLSNLRILQQQAGLASETVAAARQAEKLTINQYRSGVAQYSVVLLAQTATLSSQQQALQIRQQRLVASVNLVRALGGGWQGLAAEKQGPQTPAAAPVPEAAPVPTQPVAPPAPMPATTTPVAETGKKRVCGAVSCYWR